LSGDADDQMISSIQSEPIERVLVVPLSSGYLVEAVTDEYSRRILSCSVDKGRTVEEICLEQGIPQSTCYKRLTRLLSTGAMVVERFVVLPSGKRHAVYRSAFSHVEITWSGGAITVQAAVNQHLAYKLHNARSARLLKD
jgi:hypothetical protein